MRQHHGSGQNRAHRIGNVLPCQRWGGTVDRLKHGDLAGMNVSAGGHSKSALDTGGQIGDDVAKHIVGHNDIKLARVADHLHAEGVHVHVPGLNLRIFGRNLPEHALPQTAGVGHGVRLVAHQHAAARGSIEPFVLGRVLVCETNYALHPFSRVDVLLNGYFIVGSLLEGASGIGVNTFGVFANDHEIDVSGFNPFERAQRGIEQSHRADIRVEIELEAHTEQNLFRMHVAGNARVANRSHENGVSFFRQGCKSIGWNRGAVGQIAVGPPVEVRESERGARCLKDLDCLGDYLPANAIPEDDCNLLLAHGTEGITTEIETYLSFGVVERRPPRPCNQMCFAIIKIAMSVLQQEEHAGAEVHLRSELKALAAGCGVYKLHQSLFLVTGRDRVRWLNGMITNNVRDLADGNGVYAFVLTPQGQIRGDLYVFSRGESLSLEVERSQAETLLPLLRRYIIMDKVEIEDLSGQTSMIGVTGPKSSELLGRQGVDVSALEKLQISQLDWHGHTVTVVRMDQPVVESYEMWAAPETIGRLQSALLGTGAAEISNLALDSFRILSGVPKIGTDIREKNLPQETGQERALNFNKGCYIGQEIVERIRARGSVHKAITGFEVDGPAPAAGAKIVSDTKDAGEITSVTRVPTADGDKVLALGYLRKEYSGASLIAGESGLRVAALPFTDVLHKLS